MSSVSVNIFINITRLFADINEPESRMNSTFIIQLLLDPEDKASFKINIRRPSAYSHVVKSVLYIGLKQHFQLRLPFF